MSSITQHIKRPTGFERPPPNARQVLTPADDAHHINKHNFKVPFVCGCRDLGEALRRIAEGAAMIRTKGGDNTMLVWIPMLLCLCAVLSSSITVCVSPPLPCATATLNTIR